MDLIKSDFRNMDLLKNTYKNVPAPSEQFLVGVNCAVVTLLREIEENHKLCIKKTPKKRQPKLRRDIIHTS